LQRARWINLAIAGVRRFGAAETEEVLQLNLGLQSAKDYFPCELTRRGR
jgi:hypothetical protein